MTKPVQKFKKGQIVFSVDNVNFKVNKVKITSTIFHGSSFNDYTFDFIGVDDKSIWAYCWQKDEILFKKYNQAKNHLVAMLETKIIKLKNIKKNLVNKV